MSAPLERASLSNTRLLLQLFVFMYFIAPVPISEYIFENDFYIYSESQHTGNLVSLISGAIALVWLHFLFDYKFAARAIVARKALAKSRILANSFYLFTAYLIAVLLEGLRVRMGGASREEMLDLMDSLLLPGLGVLLLSTSIYVVAQSKKRYIAVFSVLSLLVDVTYNGKIFSFVAAVLLVFWLDFNIPSKKRARLIFLQIVAVGAIVVVGMGVSRVLLAGDDVELEALALIYTFGAEFLGVQASTGWAVDFYQSGSGITLLHFDAALQDFYLNNVGHGLATSTASFFFGNFGYMGLALQALSLTVIGVFLRLFKGTFGWVLLLIVCINFQNFLRHGFDVFVIKVATQAVFARILLGSISLKPSRQVTDALPT